MITEKRLVSLWRLLLEKESCTDECLKMWCATVTDTPFAGAARQEGEASEKSSDGLFGSFCPA